MEKSYGSERDKHISLGWIVSRERGSMAGMYVFVRVCLSVREREAMPQKENQEGSAAVTGTGARPPRTRPTITEHRSVETYR